MSSGSEADGLVVPVDVVALCVGATDAVDVAPHLAGTTAAFDTQVTPAHQAFLGANVDIGFDQSPWHQVEQGVHLHWALPDALTKASTTSGKLEFRAIPNRWLVTRILTQDGTPVTRSWLVEGDAVLAQAPAGQAPVTLPVKPGTFSGQDFGFLGRTHEVTNGFDAEAVEPALHVADTSGTALTAVTTGQVGFAAYYPSSRSVLGFHDALTDVRPATGATAALAYTVVGWYADPTQDAVQAATTPADLDALGWTYTGAGAPPSFSVYHGQVDGIAWNAHTSYLTATPPPIEAMGAIGTTPAEALAAHFAQRDHPDVPLAEKLIDAFALGLLDDFTQPKPDRLTALDEALHDRGFARAAGGTIFTIVVPDPASTTGGVTELVGLPPALAAALNALNDAQEALARARDHLDWYRRQLFADWYRIFMADQTSSDDAFDVAYERAAGWADLQQGSQKLVDDRAAKRKAVEPQLVAPMALTEVPATPYVEPADPVVALTGDGVGFPARHGGDGRYDDRGRLVCRLGANVLTALTAGGKEVDASSFTTVTAPAGLPQPDLVTALLRESCLLDTSLAAALTGVPEATLAPALTTALEGGAQSVMQLTGTPPSPIGVNRSTPDRWLPLFLSWTVTFLPFHDTGPDEMPTPYPSSFVDAGFTLDQDAGGTLIPKGGGPDPSQAAFPQTYSGSATLTPSSAAALAGRLADYLADHPDATLQTMVDQLDAAEYVTAPLSGLTDLMTMWEHQLQLAIRVPTSAPQAIQDLTTMVLGIVAGGNALGPALRVPFNPIRAGYLRVTMELIDAFGRKRDVHLPELVCSEPMVATGSAGAVASTAYLAPRLAQPSRLVFRWLAADGTGLDEMNAHPATTPVCGWLQPERLDGSLFVYAAEGKALGSLFLHQTSTGTEVGWQSAPGDDRTIDQEVETALASANVQLRALAVAIRHGSADFFTALWRTIDTVADTIETGTPSSNTGTAALVGHPVAVTQAMVRVELQGAPVLDLGWDAYTSDTDEGVTGVELPVVLGDLGRLDDGLIGFFEQDSRGGEAYAYGTFYSHAGSPGATSGVVQPTQDTLTVMPVPAMNPDEPACLAAGTRTVLMLVDPTASVHATTGMLPTASLQLPPDQVNGALSTLDFSFFTAPILRANDQLTLPVPDQSGYAVSWVEEDRTDEGGTTWTVTPDIGSPAGRAVWAYTPQSISEGWLRLNPIVLEFSLIGPDGQPVVKSGPGNALTLRIENSGRRTATFEPGAAVPEGTPAAGSIFYVHFGALVAAADVPAVTFAAASWSFTPYADVRYGPYRAATTTQAVAIAPGASVDIAVTNLTATTTAGRARVPFDFYGVDGMDDGVYVATLAVQAAPATTR